MFRPSYRDRQGRRQKSAIWWVRFWVDGRKVSVSTGTADEKEARRFQRKKAVEIEEGQTAGLVAGKLTVAQLEEAVTADYINNQRRSIRHVTLSFSYLKRHLGRLKVHQIDEDVISRYTAARLQEKAAPATVNLELSVLQRGMRLCARKLPRIPHFVYLAVKNARKGFLERPTFEAVLSAIPEHRGAARDLRPPLRVAYLTGWRLQSEILTREKHHADMSAGWLRLEPHETKNGEGRMYPIQGELREVLESQLAWTADLERMTGRVIRWLFHRNGKRIVSIQKTWEHARAAAGVPNALVHDFRRTAVRNLERAGVPRSAAMRMVGHKTQSMYSRYAIVDERMLREGAGKLDALHAQQRGEASKVVALRGPKARRRS